MKIFLILFLVSLPSSSQSEAQTVLEKQNLIKVVRDSVDKAVAEVVELLGSEDESESDNEEIIHPEIIKKGDVNLDDEFEKIVPLKFGRVSDESSDEVDNEIAEILHEAEPLGKELQVEHEAKPEIKDEEVIEEKSPEAELAKLEIKSAEIVTEVKETTDNEPPEEPEVTQSEIKIEQTHQIAEVKETSSEKIEPEIAQAEIKAQESETETLREKSSVEKEKSTQPDVEQKVSDNIDSKPIEKETQKASINDAKPSESIIDVKLEPNETPLSAVAEHSDDKPPVPIQTYLWEDVRRAKEQVSGDNVCTSICTVPSSKVTNLFCSTAGLMEV